MPKSKSVFKAFKSSFGPLVSSGSSFAASRSGTATPTTPARTPIPAHDLVLNNLATTCRITKDVSEALNRVPYVKAVTGVVAQIIKIREEVQGNKERCNEIISMVERYTYTILECLAELYGSEGEHQLEGLKAGLNSFQTYLEGILENELKPLKNQSSWQAYTKRDKDVEDMRRIERELGGFVDCFTMKAVTVGVSVAGAIKPTLSEIQQGVEDVRALKPILSEIQQSILREHWLRSQHAQYNIAHIDASLGGIDRAYCAPDTRKPVLERITTWASDRNPESPAVFWMVGEGGAGKSTIARTIAKQLDDNNAFPGVVTFFCSRKFSDTNQQVYIIPTIAYQLTGLFPYYAYELLKDADIVRSIRVVSKQMDTLLVQPWQNSSSQRPLNAPPFLVIIDALDEIISQEEGDEMSGGFAFLKSLFKAIEQGHLKGIKFLITSRPHPELSEVCLALPSEAICRLYDIPTNEVEQDICRYLHQRLPKLRSPADHELLQRIAVRADGLFIFASTAVLVANLRGRATTNEQRQALQGVLDGLTARNTTTNPVNSLYCQVLSDAFQLENAKAVADRRDLLHRIICTEDRVSVEVLVNLMLNDGEDSKDTEEMVKDLLDSLHAVLWISNGRITWYHASFLDFLLSPMSANIALPGRNLDLSCNANLQHEFLARRCFHVMRSQLKFNICHLPSSFLLDSEVGDLERRVADHISPVLRYSCRYWAVHTPKTRGNNLQEDIMQFLDKNLLFWIETMNLVQQSSLCATLLKTMQHYSARHFPDTPEVSQGLSAASHLSTVFKGSRASKSTPHLYMSTLVYTAPRFPLLQEWRTRFARLPYIHMHGIDTQLLMTLHGHTSYVNSVSFSPDNTRIVSGSNDNSVRIWNVQTGEEIQTLSGHTDWVKSVAFSSDGTRIVSGSDDYSVRIWNAQTGDESQRLDGHIDYVNSVAFSPDASHVVSGSNDRTVRVWNVQMGEEIQTLSGHTDWVNSVAFASDGARIVSGSRDGSVRVWDLQTGDQIRIISGETHSVKSVAFSPDGGRIVSGSNGSFVRVWDAETGEEVSKLIGHTDYVKSVAFSSDGARIVSGSEDRSLRVWDAQTGGHIKTLNGHIDYVKSVAFSSDGSHIVSGSDDHSLRVWDVETGDGIRTLDGHIDYVKSVAFSPDGSRIVSGSFDHSVRVWDARTGEQIKAFNGHLDWVKAVAFSSDGTHIVSGSSDQSVRVWDVQTGGEINKLDGHRGSVKSVAFSSDGARIVSGSDDHSVRVWHARTGEQIKIFNGHTDYVKSVAFSSDGALIVSGSDDHSVRLWDVHTGEQVKKLDGHTGSVKSVALCSDGARVVSGSEDRSLRVWNVRTGKQLKTLHGHTNLVNCVAFSYDNSRIVSASKDRSVRVWDVETGVEIQRLDGHTGSVKSAVFSPNGSRIVSGSNDRSVRVWDVPSPHEPQKLTHSANSTPSAFAYALASEIVLPAHPMRLLNWTVNDDGWIVDMPAKNRIMWLPDILTAYLYRPANSLIISQQTVKLDLEWAEFGSNWRLCYGK